MKRFQLLLSLLVFTLTTTTAPCGDANHAQHKLAQEAPEKLLNAKLFTLGPVDEDAKISQADYWFRALIKRPDAIAECKKLIGNGSPAGQLYGLLGLRLLDQPAFETALPKFKDSPTAVKIQFGCIEENATTGDIAARIQAGGIK
jgi:hypothetical protein